jgi:hypothetical protein
MGQQNSGPVGSMMTLMAACHNMKGFLKTSRVNSGTFRLKVADEGKVAAKKAIVDGNLSSLRPQIKNWPAPSSAATHVTASMLLSKLKCRFFRSQQCPCLKDPASL